MLVGTDIAAAGSGAQRPGGASAHTSVTLAEDGGIVEVSVRGLSIYVTASRPVQVKVFTILGQLIVQQNIAAGTTRLSVSARGIYILKAGDATCRVTV